MFPRKNIAFDQLPVGTVDRLLKPENKKMLTRVLTYHVVPGRISSAEIRKMIRAGGGKATLKTAGGGTPTAMMHGDKLVLHDEKGGMATVTTRDVFQANGVIHVIDTVLMPN